MAADLLPYFQEAPQPLNPYWSFEKVQNNFDIQEEEKCEDFMDKQELPNVVKTNKHKKINLFVLLCLFEQNNLKQKHIIKYTPYAHQPTTQIIGLPQANSTKQLIQGYRGIFIFSLDTTKLHILGKLILLGWNT